MKKIFAFVASLFFVTVAHAQDINFIVHTGPGSASDAIARAIGKELEQRIKQPVIMQNAPGADGLVALRSLANQRRPALFSTGTTLHVFGAVINNTDTSGLQILGTVATGPALWYTNPESGIKTAQDLVNAFKQNRPLRIGGDVISGRINAISLRSHYNSDKVIIVPYRTSNQVALDVSSNNLDVGLSVFNPAIQALIETGKLIPIAVTSPNGQTLVGHALPPLNKYTNAPQFLQAWIISTSTEHPVSKEIQQAFAQSIRSPEVKKIVTTLGLDHDIKDAEETQKFINHYQGVLKKLMASGVDLK